MRVQRPVYCAVRSAPTGVGKDFGRANRCTFAASRRNHIAYVARPKYLTAQAMAQPPHRRTNRYPDVDRHRGVRQTG